MRMALRAEWTELRTLSGPAWLLVASLGLLPLFSILSGAVTSPQLQRHVLQIGPMNAGPACSRRPICGA